MKPIPAVYAEPLSPAPGSTPGSTAWLVAGLGTSGLGGVRLRPTWLFKIIPFSKESFSKDEFDSLAEFGDMLWGKLQGHRFISINRGRLTIGFRPLACNEQRNGIDAILVKAAGLNEQVCIELQQFIHDNAIVDSKDNRRNQVKLHFNEGT